jgi:hypothetical protein
MARLAAKRFDADWVINNDADQFWLSGDGSLRDALAAMPQDAESLAVPHFDMLPPRTPQMPFFEDMTIRRADGKTVYGRTLQTNVCHRAFADIRVAEGNHFVLRKGVRIPERSDHLLEFAHFPIRSLAQLERKVRQGSEALSASGRTQSSTGGNWHKLYREHSGKGSLGDYYSECAPTPEQIDAGLAEGTLARDTRIRDALRRIDARLASPY